MATDREESRLQALIAIIRVASKNNIDVDKLLESAEQDVAETSEEPYSSAIKKQIRIAHALAAGSLSKTPATGVVRP